MITRRLAAILAADVVGFSSLMGQDEEGTLPRIKSLRCEVIEPKVKEHTGGPSRPPAIGFWSNSRAPLRLSAAL